MGERVANLKPRSSIRWDGEGNSDPCARTVADVDIHACECQRCRLECNALSGGDAYPNGSEFGVLPALLRR